MSKAMSGSADYHATKRSSHAMMATTGSMRASVSAPAAWRPWHAYTNMAWSQVKNGNLKTEADELARQTQSTTSLNSRSTGVNPSGPARLSRSAGSLSWERPKWNQRLAASNPNLPDKHGVARRQKNLRSYLSKPQTPSELHRHYLENPGFEAHLRSIQKPEIVHAT